MNIGLCGLGKAGQEFVRYTLYSDKFILREILCRAESKTANKTVEEVMGIITPRNIHITKIEDFQNKNNLNVIVDFSNSKTSMLLFDMCCREKINLVICTTDFIDEQLKFIAEKTVRENIGVVYAPTLTLGINILINFIKKFSAQFPDFSFEIVERHGKNKSRPTRTAKIISQAIQNKNVPINSIRLNGYVGVHEVTATDGFERISIEHESFSRTAFVRGALLACQYINNQRGFYNISNILESLNISYGGGNCPVFILAIYFIEIFIYRRHFFVVDIFYWRNER